MPREIVKVSKRGVKIGDRVVTPKKKEIVYLLIDLSDSMNLFVGTKEELSLLTGTRQVSRDGFTGLRVENSEHTSRLKTKLDVALAGMQGFVDRALGTKMIGIILFGSSAVLHHVASYDPEALRKAIPAVVQHPLRGGGTNLSDALQILTTMQGTETAVVVTDGKPNNPTRALELGKVLKEKGTDILVVGTEDADLVVPESAEVKARPLRAHLGRRAGKRNHGRLQVIELMITHYEVLGLDENATSREIRRAYIGLALCLHPDKNVGVNEMVKRIVDERLLEVREAYETLMDPTRRSEYDAALAALDGEGAYYVPAPKQNAPVKCTNCETAGSHLQSIYEGYRNEIAALEREIKELRRFGVTACRLCGASKDPSRRPPLDSVCWTCWTNVTKLVKVRKGQVVRRIVVREGTSKQPRSDRWVTAVVWFGIWLYLIFTSHRGGAGPTPYLAVLGVVIHCALNEAPRILRANKQKGR